MDRLEHIKEVALQLEAQAWAMQLGQSGWQPSSSPTHRSVFSSSPQ